MVVQVAAFAAKQLQSAASSATAGCCHHCSGKWHNCDTVTVAGCCRQHFLWSSVYSCTVPALAAEAAAAMQDPGKTFPVWMLRWRRNGGGDMIVTLGSDVMDCKLLKLR